MTRTPRAHFTSREEKAIALIDAGAVTLNFDGTATVKGSGQAVYTITHGACTCPDFVKRGADCKHVLATRALCTVYRICQSEASITGRTRLPANLTLALLGTSRNMARRRRTAQLTEELFGTV